MIRKLLKFIAILLAVVIGLAAVGILILTVAEYRPADTETVTPAGSASEILRPGDTMRVVSWNIGFGAYESDYGFFMDGAHESWAWS